MAYIQYALYIPGRKSAVRKAVLKLFIIPVK